MQKHDDNVFDYSNQTESTERLNLKMTLLRFHEVALFLILVFLLQDPFFPLQDFNFTSFFLNSLSISVCMPGLLQWKPWLPSIISCCFYCLIFSFITTENNVIIIINSIHLLNMIQFSQQRLLQYMYKIRSFVFYLQCFNNSTINVS